MGQQQLILLALAVVIVGGAIVVGIRAFNENSLKSNADAMMQDAVRIANDLQAWKQKPAPFGGQGSCITAGNCATTLTLLQVQAADDFTAAAFPLMGYQVSSASPTDYVNLNGSFRITPSPTSTLIEGVNTQFNNEIKIVVTGLSDTNLNGTIACMGGSDPAGAPCIAALDGT